MHEADVGQQSADTIKLTFKESEASKLVQFALNNELLPKYPPPLRIGVPTIPQFK
jgi:hypothetical protein